MADSSLSQNKSNIQDKNSEEDDLDTTDGFRKSLKKAFAQILCTQGNLEKNPGKDFTENRPISTKKDNPPTEMSGESDTDEYDFSHPNRGLALIINNEDFSRSKEFGDRPGSSYDASSLYHSFKALGFEVLLFHDLPAWKMVEVLKAAVKDYDHSRADCFACSILTHGDQTWSENEWDRMGTSVRLDLLFGTDGKAMATKAVVEMFNDKNCPSLINKPRLFFLQACRGDKYDDGVDLMVKRSTKSVHPVSPANRGDQKDARDEIDTSKQNAPTLPPPKDIQRQLSLSSSVDPPEYNRPLDVTDASRSHSDEEIEEKAKSGSDKTDAFWHSVKRIPVSPAPLYQDCLIMYATPPGHFAWRRRTGAWFIQCLCKLFDSNVLEHVSLQRGLSYVCGKVAREYQSENPSNLSMHHKKEVPVVESMLIKDVLMARKKRSQTPGLKKPM